MTKATDSSSAAFLEGGGELGALMRAFDWAKTPLGPLAGWPQSLKTAVRIMLTSRQPFWIGYGPELTYMYNDPYKSIIGGKHPDALGKPFSEVWREIWHVVGPMADHVIARDEGTYVESQRLIMQRYGYPEETYYTFSYSPVPGENGKPGGLICANTDDTRRVIGERQLATLNELGARTANARSRSEVCLLAAEALATNARDVPFAVVRVDGVAAATSGLDPRSAPDADRVASLTLLPLDAGTEELPSGDWPDPPSRAAVVPISAPGQAAPAGTLLVGLNPYRELDDSYTGFLQLAAAQISSAIANAEAYEEERKRAEALAELDRAKTAFFSNVSHEFRTPLTLMLGPVEDLLASAGEGDGPDRVALEVVHRNGRRLLKLVNTLLDFARIEAGRTRANYEPTQLTVFTSELASNFRSACERAGLRLDVDCPPLSESAWIDREMWEKIVLNLLSNAFKFTHRGGIGVSVREHAGEFELSVRDTGSGIPAASLPRVFERFYRVDGARGRSHEGSGIGLALVQELVKLHGGSIAVTSEPGEGSTFAVRIPKGMAHLPRERVRIESRRDPSATRAGAYVEEALSWLPDASHEAVPQSPQEGVARILLADDNADLREYARRLLADRYDVEVCADGEAALAAARARKPDLIVSDVLMPGLDGFGLLRALREDAELATVPVVLLSARAGEEARMEGLDRGADDYLVKPFSARELLVRVGSLLNAADVRREAEEAVRSSERRLRLFITNAPAGIAMFDRDMRYIAASRRWMEDYGLVGDLAGRSHYELFPEMPETWREAHRRGLAGESLGSDGDRCERSDRSVQWVKWEIHPWRDARGEVGGILIGAEDITARRNAEEAVRTSEARYRAVVESQAEMLCRFRSDGEILFVNEAYARALGATPEALVGGSFWDFVTESDRADVVAVLDRLTPDSPEARIENRFETKDGPRWTLWTNRGLVFDGRGRVLEAQSSGIDITDRKRAEEALKEADRRKDEFLATLSHELRNPLAPLSSSLQLLRHARSHAQAGAIQQIMERQVDHLVRLVDDLMEVSRITRGSFELRLEEVVLQEVLRNAIETSQPLIDADRHTLTVSLPDEPVVLVADPVRLAQVFSNLLNNSARYTPPGGRISMEARQQGAEVVVRVSDEGEGIEPELLPRIFEMFSRGNRTSRAGQTGLGIGLALVRRLVEMHDGRVEAESRGAGQGSRFTVRLPAGNARPRVEPQSRAREALVRRRVLLVDDNHDAAESLGMLLELLGAEVSVAHDGPTALAKFDERPSDLVLLDIGMPGMDGYEVAAAIRAREHGRSVRLVALTGWGQEEDRRRAHEAGFDRHLVKPASMDALRELLS